MENTKKTGCLPEGFLYHSDENQAILSSIQGLEKAMRRMDLVEGIVTLCDNQMRLHVDLHCAEGIIEPDEAILLNDGESRKDIALISRVGKPAVFRIMSLEEKDGKTVAKLSRRSAQLSCRENYLSSLLPGDLIPATVTHIEPFGAFLDIGCGISSLLSIDSISVSRISSPKDRLSVGMKIYVAVKSNDPVSGRIYTTLKELLGTWAENAAEFEVGQTVPGILRSVEPYGVFVELTPNLSGLAEVKDESISEWKSCIGKKVSVFVKSILPERMKIKLVIIDACPENVFKAPIRYFVDPDVTPHLSNWLYSPFGASKVVETQFDDPQ